MTPPELACSLAAAASSRWCDTVVNLRAFAAEVAAMSSLTGTSKLSESFETAVRLMEQASGLCGGGGGGGGGGGDNMYASV
jgi:hypothetical protein